MEIGPREATQSELQGELHQVHTAHVIETLQARL